MYKKVNTIHHVGFIPKKSLGQNFLIDEYIAEQIVYSAGDLENSIVLEVGSGTGMLTKHLLMSNAKKVIVVEIDERCVLALKQQYGHYSGRLEIVHADALSFHEDHLGTKLTIIANLPYNISMQLLIKWLHQIQLIKSMVLMFQKEVANRISAKKGSKAYGRISVISQVLCDVEHKLDVMPNSFWPAPKVISSVLKFTPISTQNIDINALEKVCKVVFAHRRKVVCKQLYVLFGNDTHNIIDEFKITANNRAEELEPELLCKLAEKLLQYT